MDGRAHDPAVAQDFAHYGAACACSAEVIAAVLAREELPGSEVNRAVPTRVS